MHSLDGTVGMTVRNGSDFRSRRFALCDSRRCGDCHSLSTSGCGLGRSGCRSQEGLVFRIGLRNGKNRKGYQGCNGSDGQHSSLGCSTKSALCRWNVVKFEPQQRKLIIPTLKTGGYVCSTASRLTSTVLERRNTQACKVLHQPYEMWALGVGGCLSTVMEGAKAAKYGGVHLLIESRRRWRLQILKNPIRGRTSMRILKYQGMTRRQQLAVMRRS